MSAARRRALALSIDHGGDLRRTALQARLATLLSALGAQGPPDAPTVDLLHGVESVLANGEMDRTWLALAVLTGRLPDDATVERTARAVRLDGPLAALGTALLRRGGEVWPTVRVVSGHVLVDVHQSEGYLTRHLAPIWDREHHPLFVAWTEGRDALRLLSSAERTHLLGQDQDPDVPAGEVLVPWHCTYVLAERVTDPARTRPLLGMLRRSGTVGALIGTGCLPLSSAEAVPAAESGGFATMLAAAAWADRIAATSEAAAVEYRGWRAMRGGTGLTGPGGQVVPLADEPEATDGLPQLDDRGIPLVLCVGSSGSGGVLAAADLLWQEGRSFCLALADAPDAAAEVEDARFTAEVVRLQGQGRPLRALTPDQLPAAYTSARCTVFPALHDDLAQPIAASLAASTPVICAGYGAMGEVAAAGGALLVDPRDDDELADALRQVLTDDGLHSRLTAEARARPSHAWEQYAEQVWTYLVTPP